MGEKPGFDSVMPVLEVSDLQRSVDYFVNKLGFRSNGVWGDPPCFCIVQRGPVTFALDLSREARVAPVNQYWAAYVYVDDADALLEEFRSRGVEIVRGPADAEYGLREFDVRDPDGHILCFAHDLLPEDAATD